jgi:sarcosine oxidase subunit alpha
MIGILNTKLNLKMLVNGKELGIIQLMEKLCMKPSKEKVKRPRESAGILDASTLGKIDIQGSDASEFLNRVYTNAWSKLAIGKCRYGLMLNEDGMVYDDGVTTRLGENHYIMTTTTGGAANVLGKLEDYLQTEWPELDVYLTSVTDHYATASVCGPNSKKILNKDSTRY